MAYVSWSHDPIAPSLLPVSTSDEHTQHQHHLHTTIWLPVVIVVVVVVVVFTPDCSSMGGYVPSLANLDLRHLGKLNGQDSIKHSICD